MEWIKNIDLVGLFGETVTLRWELNSKVNILSGGNGSGKSTLLRSVGDMLTSGHVSPERAELSHNIIITFEDGTQVSSQQSIDTKLFDGHVTTNFLPVSDVQNAIEPKQYDALCDIVDRLFASSGKHIVRSGGAFEFALGQRTIIYSNLSSGERQVLRLLDAAARSHGTGVMILDEPELSLHFDWQKEILNDILTLNSSLQLLVATHSPALIMHGWVDRVSSLEEMMINNVN